ncbi:hypothetical protein M8J75_015161 [Diaphorina citri]|nr:hypothetical protein M8J75_015161 [Diaphorina citri]
MLQFESVSDETEIGKLLRSKFTCSFRTGYVRCKGVCMPEYYVNFAEDIINMDVRDDDVWVCSFPKTGTTWTQEMVWYFEENSVVHIQNLKGRRFIKAHLPFKLLPKKLQSGTTNAKIIYVTRNPKDTCVSYYHHCHLMEGYRGDFDDFLKLFLNDAVCFAPYWDHVLEFWAVAKKRDNVLFIKYEDMKKDLGSVITQVATHLDKSLTDDQVDILKQHLSFESMKSNPATNYEFAIDFNKENKLIDDKFCAGKFMRSGQVGGWKAVMTPEIAEQFDAWTRTKTKGSDFSF